MKSTSRINIPWQVVLASASPRRIELLKQLVPDFEVLPADIAEEDHVHDDPWLTAQRTAREKALVVSSLRPNCLVIAGDTVVALPDGARTSVRIRHPDFSPEDMKSHAGPQASSLQTPWIQLAKPVDAEDACRMLRELSGTAHTVITGVALVFPGGMTAFTEATRVTFKPMTDTEIEAYVATGEPMDKAGAYGFQGGARPFVEKVEGSVTNVIGLPMEKLEEALRSLA